jgi:hypothetical protein
MTIDEAVGLLEEYHYDEHAPLKTGFEELCSEIFSDMDFIASIIFLGGPSFVQHNMELCDAANIWINATASEKRRVIEPLALNWMTEEERAKIE